MRDVSAKFTTLRTAVARAELTALPETLKTVRDGLVPKGDPFPVAKVAAVMAAKKTTEWIPYCHNIPIEHVDVRFETLPDRITVETLVTSIAKTGVEMEAIAAASAAVITLYDMLKMLDDEMVIESVRLVSKSGGKSDRGKVAGWRGGVVVVSDRASRGEYDDLSGPILVAAMTEHGAASVERVVVPDEAREIVRSVQNFVAEGRDLVMVSGGTGVGERDVTFSALRELIEVPLPGVVSALATYGQDRTPLAMLGRPLAGLLGGAIVVVVPGSPAACRDAAAVVFPTVLHARAVLLGDGHS